MVAKLTGLVPAATKSSDASLKRVTQADPISHEDRKLLTERDLQEGNGMAEREGFGLSAILWIL